MQDLLMASLVMVLLTMVLMTGVGLGWWVRHQLALAHMLTQSAEKRREVLIPGDAEIAARELQSQAEINKKLRKMGLPHEEV